MSCKCKKLKSRKIALLGSNTQICKMYYTPTSIGEGVCYITEEGVAQEVSKDIDV